VSSDSARALQDLRAKLILEQKFRPAIQKLNRKIVRTFIKGYAKEGILIQASRFDDDLNNLLTKHYGRVETSFKGNISDLLSVSTAQTDSETDIINSALGLFLVERASEQTSIINNTTQQNMNVSISEAIQLSQEQPEQVGISQQELAMTAGALLSLKLAQRVSGIVSTETQFIAEAIKDTEVTVLSGLEPSTITGTTRNVDVNKEWFTVGDERVRPAHVVADSQIRKVGDTFTVAGEPLRWPGDMGLGASLSNVINCRCSSIHDIDQLISVRLQPGFEPFIEN